MAGIVAREPSALSELYDRYSGQVFGLCLRVLRSRPEAEEVLGDVFWEVWQRAERYQPGRGTPLAYLATLARSRSIDRLRSRRRDEVLVDPEMPDAEDRSHSGVAQPGSPFDDAVIAEQRERIREALAGLSAKQRTALEMSYFDGFSHTEIATQLNEPLGTVKTRIRQGLIRLRSVLGGLYGSREVA